MSLPYSDAVGLNRKMMYSHGRIPVNGATALVQASILGQGFTATRTGVGVMTIKINAPAKAVLDFDARVWNSVVIARRIDVTACVQGADGCWTFTINQTDLAAAPVEWSVANAANWVSFSAALQLTAP